MGPESEEKEKSARRHEDATKGEKTTLQSDRTYHIVIAGHEHLQTGDDYLTLIIASLTSPIEHLVEGGVLDEVQMAGDVVYAGINDIS